MPAVPPKGEVSRLCSEAAIRLRAYRHRGDLNEVLLAIKRVGDALKFYFSPPRPVHLADYEASAHVSLFATLSQVLPGEDWQHIFSIEAGDPDQSRSFAYYFYAKAASGRAEFFFDSTQPRASRLSEALMLASGGTEFLLDGNGRLDVATCLDHWAHFFAEPSPGPPTPPVPSIFYLGDRHYRTGNETVVVTEREDDVLQAFLDQLALDKSQLADRSGHDAGEAVRVLRALCSPEKYGGIFAPFIRLPGGRGKGGYKVHVRRG